MSDPPADLLLSIMASRRTLKAVLIDLSGTLHVEDTAVPGAQEALNRWERFRFLVYHCYLRHLMRTQLHFPVSPDYGRRLSL